MKSVKKLLVAATLFCAVVVSLADNNTFQWDFQKSGVLKSKYPLFLRGKSTVDSNGLTVPVGAKKDRAGAVADKKVSAAFFTGNFAVTADFSISSKENHHQANLMLLDSKYVLRGKKEDLHRGFMLFLKRGNTPETYTPAAAFGYGNESVVIYGESKVITSDVRHTLKMIYDCRGQVRFILDGRTSGSCKVPAKAVVPAVLPLHIGDRAGADYWPLGGRVYRVELEKLPPKAALPSGSVLGKWDFTKPGVLNAEHSVKLRGGAKLSDSGLVVFNTNVRQADGAVLSGYYPELTPENAFELTAKLSLSPGYPRSRTWAMIFDAKYVAMPRSDAQKRFHKGFAFFLMPLGNDVYRLGAAFGYGDKSTQVSSGKVTLVPGKDYTLLLHFTATGKVFFSVDGKTVGTANVPAGSVVAPDVSVTFADRAGANYYPLGGTLKSVELRSAEFSPQDFSADVTKRLVFERGEKDAFVWVNFLNFSDRDIKAVTVHAGSAGVKFAPVKNITANKNSETALRFPVDTALLPGKYTLDLFAIDEANKKIAQKSIEYVIVPAYGDFLPVMLWGNYEDIKAIREAGFTHQLVHLFPRTGNFDSATLKQWIPHLDNNLKEGLYTFGTLHSHFRYIAAKRHLRTGKDGKVYPRANLEASHPQVREEFSQAAASTVKAVGGHPAFDGVLINSEVRDGALPSFGSGVEPAAFKKFAGFDIPETISGKSPKPYAGDHSFPWDRVIPDDKKDLVFLKWFWDVGDGWNPLQTLLSKSMHDALTAERSKRFFTFYDPATRVPPMWGSGGKVDMISQWTYAYPDPIKIGQATDEVIAMAQGNPGQKVASMTQAIWYRSQTAPVNKTVKNPPAWLNEEREAMFISLSPDSLREAFWSKISRRLDAVMYHGVGSLLAKTDHKLYRLTNYESKKVLAELCRDVVLPLGPVLKRVPEKPADVAILHSLAASFYAPKHFPMGWSKGWAADLHLALQWGNFQPAIVFDEHLLKERNIEKLKVLFVPGLEVVTEKVLAKLNCLRQRGVIIIGDEFTVPALMVDHRIKSVVRNTNDPVASKKALQKLGMELAVLLDKHVPRAAKASNQDLVVRQRGNNNADYVFVVNDKRTFGDYIGQWKMVQEKGLPNSGTVTVNHSAEAAYDLVLHKEIELKKSAVSCSFDVALSPGDGKVILLLDRKISKLALSVPETVKRRESFDIKCQILDGKGNTVKACIPVELKMTAADGTVLPGSGYYAAENGVLQIKETMASNAPKGAFDISVRCLASGKKVSVKAMIK